VGLARRVAAASAGPTDKMLAMDEPMGSDSLAERVRELRERGCSPKEIARRLRVPPAQVVPLVRAIAAEGRSAAGESPVVGCWISTGWRVGLSVAGHPDWPGLQGVTESGGSGLVGVLVARQDQRGRVSACGYLVDVYCLGVKDVIGPSVMDEHRLDQFTGGFFSAFDQPPLAAPIELAQHLVLGAVEYARGLGFEPAADFAAAKGHLGSWTGHSAIGFGRDGKPLFVQGPRDNAKQILQTLQRSVGESNYHYLVVA
jgi:hypothetical protein